MLSLLFNAMVVHGFVPNSLTRSNISPIVKNKCASLSVPSKYRPIALSSNISKVFELCLLDSISRNFCLTDNQFGFRPKLGTEMCIFALKETVSLYISRDSPVFVAFLDASKAFDRVSHSKLFRKLCDSNVPVCVTRVLWYWYRHQQLNVKWGTAVSSYFSVSNGVRQGSVLSPLLFNIYMNELSQRLNCLPAYCVLGNAKINHLFYADDICLIVPSILGLRMILRECEKYGDEYDILFNSSKSHCLYFTPSGSKITRYGDVFINGSMIRCAKSVMYLGHVISCNMSDEDDMTRQKRILYCRGNQLSRSFFNCSDAVKQSLFKALCYCIYGCSLWNVFRVETLRRVKVAYNSAFRHLFGYRRTDSASQIFVSHRVNTFLAVTRNAASSLSQRVSVSRNSVISGLRDVTSSSVLRSRWRALLRPA